MSKHKPPKFLVWFFQWYCQDRLQESILGDLEEQFEEDLESQGVGKAKRRFTWNVIRFFRPGIIKSFTVLQNSNISMLKSYFKIAYRNILKYKFFSTINIVGLAIGIAMSLLISIHVYNELSYESSYPKHNEIYRLASEDWAKMPPMLATEFKEKMPGVQSVGRLFGLGPKAMSYSNKELLTEHPYIADPSILDIFDVVFVEGGADALDGPSTIVLTESMADRYFEAGQNRIGEVVELGDNNKSVVTGIIKDFPKNSHLKIDCMLSSVGTFITSDDSRSWSGVSIFAWIASKNDLAIIEEKLLDFELEFRASFGSREEIIEEYDRLELHPVAEIHLNSHREKEIEANSDIKLIYVFFTLVIFILIVVIINFINLYVAQTLNRIKEIGVRKVMGAYRSQLMLQFFSEAFFLVIISALFALMITYWLLPYYNSFVSIDITPNELFSTKVLLSLFTLVLIVSGLAGGYPAIYLSKLGISHGVGNRGLKIGGNLSLRKTMVALQFLISISLLTATLIVSKQMGFIESKDMGFAQEEVIAIRLHGKLKTHAITHTDQVRNELLKHNDVVSASFSSYLIGSRFGMEPFVLRNDPENENSCRVLITDPWFIETLGVTVLDGGLESKYFAERKYFFNETAVELFDADDFFGQTIYNSWQENEGEVVGVIQDFHFASLHNEVGPLVVQVSNETYAINYLLVRVKSNKIYETIESVESILKEIEPESLIISQMVDDNLDQSYLAEHNMFSIFKTFSTVIIGLACIGLFALFAFIAQAATKEMGIRKILGASMLQILLIMSKGYIGILIAMAPFAIISVYYLGSRWLDGFAYRASVDWWHLVLPSLVVLVLAVVAIAAQCWRVAVVNPVESLRDD